MNRNPHSWHSGCLNEALRVELEPFSGPNNHALRYTPGIGKCNAVTEKKSRKEKQEICAQDTQPGLWKW
jgi:hypothetical protein